MQFLYHVLPFVCHHMLPEDPLERREDGFYYPPISVAYAVLPVLIIGKLRYDCHLARVAALGVHGRVLPYLDSRYDVIVVCIGEVVSRVVCCVCQHLRYGSVESQSDSSLCVKSSDWTDRSFLGYQITPSNIHSISL